MDHKTHLILVLIPNTAVFGPTNFIETIASTTTATTTARMKISDEDFYGYRKIGVTKRVTELPNVDRFENGKRI